MFPDKSHRRNCIQEGCTNDTIPFCEKCSDHETSEDIVKSLNELDLSKIENTHFIDFEISDLHLEDKTFILSNFKDLNIEDSTFVKCKFLTTFFINVYFGECVFEDCTFESSTEIQSCHFNNCEIANTQFRDVEINQTSFQEETQIKESTFDLVNLTGNLFDDMVIERTTFSKVHLNQSSMNDSTLSEVEFIYSDVYKMTFWNCLISGSLFQNVRNDFDELVDSIELCLLTNTKFINTFLPEHFHKWNGIDVEASLFYRGVIDKFWKNEINFNLQYIDNLHPIVTAVSQLDKVEDPDFDSQKKVYEIFSKFLNLARQEEDIISLGQILNKFGHIPFRWRINSNAFLPSPSKNLVSSYLKIISYNKNSTLESVSEFLNDLRILESTFDQVQESRLEITSIEKGSIVIVLSGGLHLIVFIAWALHKGANLYLDISKKVLDNKNVCLQNDKLKLEIKEQKESKAAIKEDREIEKLELEILTLRKSQMETLQTISKIDPVLELPQLTQEEAYENGKKILEKHGELDLHVMFTGEGKSQ